MVQVAKHQSVSGGIVFILVIVDVFIAAMIKFHNFLLVFSNQYKNIVMIRRLLSTRTMSL